MPVPPAEPFNARRYEIEGNPASVRGAEDGWQLFARALGQAESMIGESVSRTAFSGPEATTWRNLATAHLDAMGVAADGIRKAGQGLAQWAAALETAKTRMVPVLVEATHSHADLEYAVSRVGLAEQLEALAQANLTVAESELATALTVTGATGGAVIAAQAHVTQAGTELTRATTEVGLAHANYQRALTRWNAANAEADSVQKDLSRASESAAGTVRSGARHGDRVRASSTQARNVKAGSQAGGTATVAGLVHSLNTSGGVTEPSTRSAGTGRTGTPVSVDTGVIATSHTSSTSATTVQASTNPTAVASADNRGGIPFFAFPNPAGRSTGARRTKKTNDYDDLAVQRTLDEDDDDADDQDPGSTARV